ncbi:MAG: hypothetical protein IJS32_02200, partial [Kiritimatiellae bacterium]|nr:hypothetical protein [Kiritimatiellia bacterium]
SWPEDPVHKAQLVVTGAPPMSNALPVRVAVSGLVDDAITVDGNQVWWANGAKVFEDFEVTDSITNLAGGSFRVDLYDWPDLPNGGDNEVRLGREDYPFRVEWTWAVPMDFRLEHITTNGAPLVVNPSGTEPTREITCVATVLPTNIPDSDIHWEVSGAGMDFVGGTNWGREVHLAATRTGDWVAIVTVSNSTLRPARLRGTVLEKKDVNVYLHIVRDDNGNNPAMTVEHFDELLAVANQIWEQAAINFQLTSDVYTNKTDWLEISVTNNFEEYGQLQSWSSNTGGIEVYCINRFDGANYNALTWTVSDAKAGVTITTNATSRSLAHELGHACGLPDIYESRASGGQTASLSSNLVQQSWLPQDWCANAPNGGYGQLQQRQLLHRLLMYGYAESDAVVIPAGPIHGIDRHAVETNLKVGLSNMTREPQSW